MANYLASDTTLAQFRAMVLAQLGINSVQDAGITAPEIADVLHNAIQNFRSVAGPLVDNFYMTDDSSVVAAGTLASNKVSIDISTLRISDITKCSLWLESATGPIVYGEVPIVSQRKFNAIKSLYSTTNMTTSGAVATIIGGTSITSGVLTLKIYAGTAAGLLTNSVLTYPRNPIKQTTDSGMIDLPQAFVPLVRDIATVYLAKRLAKSVPADVQASVQNGVQSLISQLSLDMSTTPEQK